MKNFELAKKMQAYAQTLEAGTRRAQAYNISAKLKDLDINESTIAEMMINDHRDSSSALRHAKLLVEAGLGFVTENKQKHLYGVTTFIDGSTL